MSNMLIYVYQICPHALCRAYQASSALWVETRGGRWRKEGNSLIFRSAWKAWLKSVAAVTFWGPLEKNCLRDICSFSKTVERVKSTSLKAMGTAEVISYAFLVLWQSRGWLHGDQLQVAFGKGGFFLKCLGYYLQLWCFYDQLSFFICFVSISFYFQNTFKEEVKYTFSCI